MHLQFRALGPSVPACPVLAAMDMNNIPGSSRVLPGSTMGNNNNSRLVENVKLEC